MESNWNINNDHRKILDILFDTFNSEEKYAILDIGTGRTSLKYLTDKFANGIVSAITYPGDYRKINSIKESVHNQNYKLIEADLCEYEDSNEYDIVLAHLLLGEAGKFNSDSFDTLLHKLFNIKTKYLIIIDYKEDDCIDYSKIENYAKKSGIIQKLVEIVRTDILENKEFIGKTFKGYLIKKL